MKTASKAFLQIQSLERAMGKYFPAGSPAYGDTFRDWFKDPSTRVSKERKPQAEMKLPQLMNCLAYRSVLAQKRWSCQKRMIVPLFIHAQHKCYWVSWFAHLWKQALWQGTVSSRSLWGKWSRETQVGGWRNETREGRELRKGALSSWFPRWAAGAGSCWGTSGQSKEYAWSVLWLWGKSDKLKKKKRVISYLTTSLPLVEGWFWGH